MRKFLKIYLLWKDWLDFETILDNVHLMTFFKKCAQNFDSSRNMALISQRCSLCDEPTRVAQWWACLTHDLVVVSLILGWGKLSFCHTNTVCKIFICLETWLILQRCSLCDEPTLMAQWRACLTHDQVIVSDRHPVEAKFLCSVILPLTSEACEKNSGFGKKVLLVLVWESQETCVSLTTMIWP